MPHGANLCQEVSFIPCLTRRALPSGRSSGFEGRTDLPDITNPGTPPADASGDLSLPVLWWTMWREQNEIRAPAWRRGKRVSSPAITGGGDGRMWWHRWIHAGPILGGSRTPIT